METQELLATVLEASDNPDMSLVVKVYTQAFEQSKDLNDVVAQVCGRVWKRVLGSSTDVLAAIRSAFSMPLSKV